MTLYKAGIDIGSTTVKLVILNENNNITYGNYKRHFSNIQKTLTDLLYDARTKIGDIPLSVRITGSGALALSRLLKIDFLQEVVAVASALETLYPKIDVAVELGGEDAKIIYFDNGIEQRMNGICAGGTGSFIDQMAALLQTDASGLNDAAKDYKEIYPIAARCGVFAKTDIQPLINEGVSKADLSASIFQAVVNQTVSGLACGRRIKGNVAFLGGPLHFLSELKKAFIRTLKLSDENVIDPDNSHLFAAIGAAMDTNSTADYQLSELIETLEGGVDISSEMSRLEPLFANDEEKQKFFDRHQNANVIQCDLKSYSGNCYLGIDAGSTTTKMVLIGDNGELLFSYYSGNQGDPVNAACMAVKELKSQIPETAKIVRSCSTGYGEALLKSAFSLDEGEVETVAHCTAAKFFTPDVDCVLDIGGQDMKCITLKGGAVDNVVLNEACSSGCGSFIENFANSLNLSVEEFAKSALTSKNPVDLGTRCTVFMNSNVKQAQKEGADVSDISAGLAYSVVKNALFKVIKLTSGDELGKNIVVQGGTFHNSAVLRAFEKISGVNVVCPKISGIMGAFGAALIAKERYNNQPSSMLSLSELINLKYTTSAKRCGGCTNNCMLTVNKFSDSRVYISGNRCEKGIGNTAENKKLPNMVEYKRKRIFDYEPLSPDKAFRGTIGIPRILNIYENYPFWATFFKKLGFRVVLSPFSTRKIYELGMETIPSESACYPAKISHGHISWLINNGVDTIFHPCVFYERQETKDSQNHFNCPIVISYAENLKNNVDAIAEGNIKYIRPFISFADRKSVSGRLIKLCKKEWNIDKSEVLRAVTAAWDEQLNSKADIQAEGKRILAEMEKNGGLGIVLAGRPYHIDPEINHGIPELISSYGFTVFTEDSLPTNVSYNRPLRVLDQWTYHSRLYSAAEFIKGRNDLELIQLNSFGCGLDAVTSDQVCEILEGSNKLYTVLKIDEVNNLGAVRIRIRSLLAAINMRKANKVLAKPASSAYIRSEFTKEMRKDNYTIIAPRMSPLHFSILESAFNKYGYNLEILKNDNRAAIDTGLKYVNNDACYPSIVVVGQIMDAVLSGKYDTDKLAIMMSQTGGCCRASNYVGFIRRALNKAGLSHIPVISLNAGKIETNNGFKLSAKLLIDAIKSLIYGDVIMRCLYATRPYECVLGSANKLADKWITVCQKSITDKKSGYKFNEVCQHIVDDFDTLPIDETIKKVRVGIVGEILVKYMPLANNNLVNILEKEDAEVVVPDFIDFINYSLYNGKYKHKYLGKKAISEIASDIGISLINLIRKPAVEALKNSKRFDAPVHISKIANLTKPFLSLGNQYGEGWFLTGEMAELLSTDVNNIVCIQPFGCLPNHVVGKGVIKKLKAIYPKANIAAIDYDPGASEVNQLNRIKLMLATAKKELKQPDKKIKGSKNIQKILSQKGHQ